MSQDEAGAAWHDSIAAERLGRVSVSMVILNLLSRNYKDGGRDLTLLSKVRVFEPCVLLI